MSAKTTQLRRMLDSGETEFILEAHNGLAARIVEEAGRTVLEDLDSANGIVLNGERVKGKAALFDGDVIQIGEVRLRYLVGDGAE